MNKETLERLHFRLAFSPHGDEVTRFIDYYKEDVPMLISYCRELREQLTKIRHEFTCYRTQGGEHVEFQEEKTEADV